MEIKKDAQTRRQTKGDKGRSRSDRQRHLNKEKTEADKEKERKEGDRCGDRRRHKQRGQEKTDRETGETELRVAAGYNSISKTYLHNIIADFMFKHQFC